jgi:ribosomal protein L11 methyltransferase
VFFATADLRDGAARAIGQIWPTLQLASIDVPDEDWAARSQRALAAVTAGRFVIAPPWDRPSSPPEGAIVIVIEPSMGFGTGHHPTTRLCLRLLSSIDVRGRRVLDLGTGSGVLAMAAAALGAPDVLGLDVDQDAIDAARRSAALNTVPSTLGFETQDFRVNPPAPADLILANLTGGMLRTAASLLTSLLRPGGTLIVSGFDESEETAVAEAFAPLEVAERIEEMTWVAMRLGQRQVPESVTSPGVVVP